MVFFTNTSEFSRPSLKLRLVIPPHYVQVIGIFVKLWKF